MEKKEKLTAARTKAEFVNSIYVWLMRTLKEYGEEEYQSCFTVEGSSIMCNLPTNYFQRLKFPKEQKLK